MGSPSKARASKEESTFTVVFRWEKFKIFLIWQQIFGQMKFNYNIPWPKSLSVYMRLYSVFQLDFFSVLPLACIMKTNYYFGLTVSVFLPLFMMLIIAVLTMIGRSVYKRKLNRIPRKCVKTGRQLRGVWLPNKIVKQLQAKFARRA